MKEEGKGGIDGIVDSIPGMDSEWIMNSLHSRQSCTQIFLAVKRIINDQSKRKSNTDKR